MWNSYVRDKGLRLDSAYDELTPALKAQVDQAVRDHIARITGLGEYARAKVRDALVTAEAQQLSLVETARLFEPVLGSRSVFIARDQVLTLQSNVNEARSRELGIESYEWSTSGDSRVRPEHRRLAGQMIKWSNPPVVDPKTGRRAHAGRDYQCRCVALPDVDSVL